MAKIAATPFPYLRRDGLIASSYSVQRNNSGLNVLNVSGAGTLFCVRIQSYDVPPGEKYVKITLDNFSFYLDCSSNDSPKSSIYDDGILCPVSCLSSMNGIYSNYNYHCSFDVFSSSYTVRDYIINGNAFTMPIDAKDEPKRVILTPRPLRFNDNLKIDAYSGSDNEDLSINVIYKIDA